MSKLKTPDAYYEIARTDVRDIVEAVWWPASPSGQQGSIPDSELHTICMNGELHLPGNLVPSSSFPICSVKVCRCCLSKRHRKQSLTGFFDNSTLCRCAPSTLRGLKWKMQTSLYWIILWVLSPPTPRGLVRSDLRRRVMILNVHWQYTIMDYHNKVMNGLAL